MVADYDDIPLILAPDFTLDDEHVPSQAAQRLFVGDVFTAGAKLVLAMVAAVDPAFDPAFDTSAIVASARTWAAWFVRPASARALASLAAVAPSWELRFPGIERAIADAAAG